MKVFPGRIIEPGYDPGFSSWFKKATKSEKIILTQYNRTNIGTIAKAERFWAGVGIQAKSRLKHSGWIFVFDTVDLRLGFVVQISFFGLKYPKIRLKIRLLRFPNTSSEIWDVSLPTPGQW